MPNQSTTEPEPTSSVSATDSRNENQRVSLNCSQILNLCAAGLFICFFLPWVRFGGPSGFDLAKEGKGYELLYFLWSIPILSGLTIFAGLARSGQKIVAVLTGVIPFLILGWGLNNIGEQLFQILAIGAYASLALGLVMLIVACRLKYWDRV